MRKRRGTDTAEVRAELILTPMGPPVSRRGVHLNAENEYRVLIRQLGREDSSWRVRRIAKSVMRLKRTTATTA